MAEESCRCVIGFVTLSLKSSLQSGFTPGITVLIAWTAPSKKELLKGRGSMNVWIEGKGWKNGKKRNRGGWEEIRININLQVKWWEIYLETPASCPHPDEYLQGLAFLECPSHCVTAIPDLCLKEYLLLPQAFLWTPSSRQQDSLGTLQKNIYCSLHLAEHKYLAPCACLKLSLPFSLGPLLSPVLCLLCVHGCPADTHGVSGHHILHLQQLLGGDTSPCVHAGASVQVCAGVSGSRAHLAHGTEQIQQGHLTHRLALVRLSESQFKRAAKAK